VDAFQTAALGDIHKKSLAKLIRQASPNLLNVLWNVFQKFKPFQRLQSLAQLAQPNLPGATAYSRIPSLAPVNAGSV
jgi:hypothetical protein